MDYKWHQDPNLLAERFPNLSWVSSHHTEELYPNPISDSLPTSVTRSREISLKKLLSTLATMLDDLAMASPPDVHADMLHRVPYWPFLYPFQDGSCMLFDPQRVKVKKAEGIPIFVSKKSKTCSYLEMNLGKGYPKVTDVVISAHRMLCWAFHGHVPPGSNVVVEHLCQNSMCWNPLHLTYGTKSTNGYRLSGGRGM